MRALTLKGSKEIKVHMHIHSSWVVSEYHSVLDYHSAVDGRNHVFANMCTDPPSLRFFLRGGGVCTQAS